MFQNFEIDLLFSLRLETRGFPVHNALAAPAPASLNRLPPPTGTTAASRCWSIGHVCSNCSIVHKDSSGNKSDITKFNNMIVWNKTAINL